MQPIQRTKQLYRHLMGDSLRRNSTLLILSQAINAGAVFLFWIICAHLFRANIIGLATSFITFGTLVATFTTLGLPNTVIRFLPTSKKRVGLFMSSLYLVVMCSIIGGGITWTFIKTLVPKLGFVHSSSLLGGLLIFNIILTVVSMLCDGTLMAFRKGEYILGKALVINLPRLLLPFVITARGITSIAAIYTVVLIFGVIYNLFIILRRLLPREQFKPTLAEIKRHKSYAASNYFGGMLGILPSTLVPIIVLSKLGASSAAYFYMPMQIATFLGIICSSASAALISESSQSDSDTDHRKHFVNAFLYMYRMLIPAIIALSLLAWPILRTYGTQYANQGTLPLCILALASLFVGINWLGDTWLNIQKLTRAYFLMNALNAFTVVGSVFLFAHHSLVAVSIGWLIGQVVSAVIYLIIFGRSSLLPTVTSLKPHTLAAESNK